MKVYQFIINLCFSVLFVLAPTYGLHAEIYHSTAIDVACCDESCDMNTSETTSCDHSQASHTPDDCRDNCKDSCNDHASHVVPQTIQSPTSRTEKPESFITIKKLQTTYYQELSLQNFIFQFWNPPK